MSEKYKVEDVFIYKDSNVSFLYSPLDKVLISLDEDEFDFLKSNLSQVSWKKYLQGMGYEIFVAQKPKVDEFIVEGEYDGIVLLMTNACNMGCKYCYAADSQFKASSINEDTIKSSLEYAFAHMKKGLETFSIAFHGYGECSLEFSKIKDIVEYTSQYLKEKDIKPEYQITTNGTFSENECVWLIENDFRFNISLDGDKDTHDLMRLGKNKKSFHNKIVTSIERISKSQCKKKLHIRATVTKYTVYKMLNSLRYFHSIGARSVQFEPMTARGGTEDKWDNLSVDITEFENNIKECIVEASKLGMRFFYSSINFGIAVRFCSSNSKFVVDYEGRVLACVQAAPKSGLDFFKYGELDKNSIKLDTKKLNNINTYSVYDELECQSCLLKYHCSGDCKAHRIDMQNDTETFKNKCKHNESLFAWILKNMLENQEKVQSVIDFELEEV